MQVALGFSICILVLIVHSSYSPYYDAIQNRVSQICMIELACILFVGLLFKMEILSNGSASSDILSYFVVLLCIMVMIDPLLYNALTFGLGARFSWFPQLLSSLKQVDYTPFCKLCSVYADRWVAMDRGSVSTLMLCSVCILLYVHAAALIIRNCSVQFNLVS